MSHKEVKAEMKVRGMIILHKGKCELGNMKECLLTYLSDPPAHQNLLCPGKCLQTNEVTTGGVRPTLSHHNCQQQEHVMSEEGVTCRRGRLGQLTVTQMTVTLSSINTQIVEHLCCLSPPCCLSGLHLAILHLHLAGLHLHYAVVSTSTLPFSTSTSLGSTSPWSPPHWSPPPPCWSTPPPCWAPPLPFSTSPGSISTLLVSTLLFSTSLVSTPTLLWSPPHCGLHLTVLHLAVLHLAVLHLAVVSTSLWSPPCCGLHLTVVSTSPWSPPPPCCSPPHWSPPCCSSPCRSPPPPC